MDCKRLFEMLSLFSDTNKTDMSSEQLGLISYDVIKSLDGASNYKNLLLDASERLSLKKLEFSKNYVNFVLNINDPVYSFFKFFAISMKYDYVYPHDDIFNIKMKYGIYGKSGKKLNVCDFWEPYNYEKTYGYLKPIIDNFCNDKI